MEIERIPKGWAVNIKYSIKVNGRAVGWRRRVAAWLRRRADRLDGRRSLAVLVKTDPALPDEEVACIIKAGLDFVYEHIRAATREAADEAILRHARPDLYEDERK